MVRDYDPNEFPLAYLITIRCYGTWLHGDSRGSMRRTSNEFGTTRLPPRPKLKEMETTQLKYRPKKLNAAQRHVVDRAIREVCTHRKYGLHAMTVRSNHAHIVVSVNGKPEEAMDSFKAYSTRAMREAGLWPPKLKPWARHGSTIYLWKDRQVEKAVEYVVNGQGEELAKFVGQLTVRSMRQKE